jgi:hypothetical protein
MIILAVPLFEGLAPLQDLYKSGILVLLADGLCAWGLNMASMGVIASVGSLALCLSGYIKVNPLFIVPLASIGIETGSSW